MLGGRMAGDPNIENCSKIFISWQWALGIVISFVIVIVSIAWATSSAYTHISEIQQSQGQDISRLKMVYQDIDTVKSLIREQNRLIQLNTIANSKPRQ